MTGRLDFVSAMSFCNSLGSRLAHAHDLNEFQVIKSLFPKNSNAWIGLKKEIEAPYDLVWTLNHTNYTFSDDTATILDEVTKKCAFLNSDSDGTTIIEDADCEETHLFACQRDCPFKPYIQSKFLKNISVELITLKMFSIWQFVSLDILE